MIKDIQKQLLDLNVTEYTEQKQGLTYLSWSHAWEQVLLIYPEATYEIKKDENMLPYFGDPTVGYIVYTSVTIENVTREMWLPVLDGANAPMKKEAYEYETKYKTKTCAAMNMFDVNKTIMRCLTKNLAMFGLAIYLYKGEDLPLVEKLEQTKEEKELERLAELQSLRDYCYEGQSKLKITNERIKELYGDTIDKLDKPELESFVRDINRKIQKIKKATQNAQKA